MLLGVSCECYFTFEPTPLSCRNNQHMFACQWCFLKQVQCFFRHLSPCQNKEERRVLLFNPETIASLNYFALVCQKRLFSLEKAARTPLSSCGKPHWNLTSLFKQDVNFAFRAFWCCRDLFSFKVLDDPSLWNRYSFAFSWRGSIWKSAPSWKIARSFRTIEFRLF